MPQIRKKTSKRGTSFQRSKIRHKVSESHRKAKRAAKKNPQWKSKHKKDPGIPNNLPFKEEILAEIAETRRLAEEKKQKLKEQRKAAKAGTDTKATEDDKDEEEEGSEAVSSAKIVTASTAGPSKPAPKKKVEEAPLLLDQEFPHLKAVIDKADVLLEVLDARDPLSFRSEYLENLAQSPKKLVFVLNKIDTVPRETLVAWLDYLRPIAPTFLFRSASEFLPRESEKRVEPVKGKEREDSADDAVGVDALLECLEIFAKEKGSEPLTVAVAGITNSGKSSVVNSLARRAASPVYSLATLGEGHSSTPYPINVPITTSNHKISVIDTPGLAWEKQEEDESTGRELAMRRGHDVLMRSRGKIEKMKDPIPAISYLISRADVEDLMLHYTLPAFGSSDHEAFLRAVARANGFVKKGGFLDLTGAAKLVLRDWSVGKIPYYTTPPSSPSTPSSSSQLDTVKAIYGRADEAATATTRTRKERRLAEGLVRLSPGSVDTRPVALIPTVETPAFHDVGDDDEMEDDDEAQQESDKDSDAESEAIESEPEEDEEVAPSSKRKRVVQEPLPERPVKVKKVTFASTKTKTKTKPTKKEKPAPAQSKGPVARPAKSAPQKPAKASGKSGQGQSYDFSQFF
ncbi:hypothetical protein SISNIDRAFT_481788 [Sistotremastrum niveocremeum HHB9708]|uniref:P-loop containing nucleoside triphosphate hydrolase protein n=1 Tax=Sistotremastrum niveocremeum HHB9708 TaxID=1314777 RepID=A0A164ZPC0_9AGAM|nr:hypothetical protein SISNIDRAFT_481788 [Sistotremastrum niveocremeum HHB9708]